MSNTKFVINDNLTGMKLSQIRLLCKNTVYDTGTSRNICFRYLLEAILMLGIGEKNHNRLSGK